MNKPLDIREVAVLIDGDTEPMTAYVSVGYTYDEDGDEIMDDRIFYYFEDEAELEEARTKGTGWFRVVD